MGWILCLTFSFSPWSTWRGYRWRFIRIVCTQKIPGILKYNKHWVQFVQVSYPNHQNYYLFIYLLSFVQHYLHYCSGNCSRNIAFVWGLLNLILISSFEAIVFPVVVDSIIISRVNPKMNLLDFGCAPSCFAVEEHNGESTWRFFKIILESKWYVHCDCRLFVSEPIQIGSTPSLSADKSLCVAVSCRFMCMK